MTSTTAEIEKPKKFKLALHWQIAIGMSLGFLVGWLFNSLGGPNSCTFESKGFYEATHQMLSVSTFSWMGALFLKLLKLVVIPLIFCALINGISHMKVTQLGKVGVVSLLVFKGTMVIAALLGLFWVNLIKPGVGFDVGLLTSGGEVEVEMHHNSGSILMDIVPLNFFHALSQDSQIIQVIFCALVFGIALAVSGDKAKAVGRFFQEMFGIMIKITHWVMTIAPFGVFGMLVKSIASAGLGVFISLGWYMITVALGLASMLFIVTPLLVWIFAKVSPKRFFAGVAPAMLTSFSTASTAATIPVSLDCVHKRLGVPFSLSSFIIPTAATMNMNGAALYEGVVTLFLAQAYAAYDPSIDLSLGGQIFILFMVLLSTLGTPGIPHGGLITTTIVLKAVGLPIDALGLIVAVDRILDMCRTMTNTTGDCASALIINGIVGGDNLETDHELEEFESMLDEDENSSAAPAHH